MSRRRPLSCSRAGCGRKGKKRKDELDGEGGRVSNDTAKVKVLYKVTHSAEIQGRLRSKGAQKEGSAAVKT